LLEKTITHIGQPNSAPHALSTYALFEEIHKQGFKLALTGEGADEMFGGYQRFATAAFDHSAGWMESYMDKLSAFPKSIRQNIWHESFKKLSDVNKPENDTKNQLLKFLHNHTKPDALLKFDQDCRFPYYILRRVDHLSMANAVEVRVPFCLTKIKSIAKSLPQSFKLDKTSVKKILYSAAKDKVEASILHRKKQPFTLPITQMLQEPFPLIKMAKNFLLSEQCMKRKIFNLSYVKHLFDLQEHNAQNHYAESLWSMLVLEMWMQLFSADYRVE